MTTLFRKASPFDAFKIVKLYHELYQGNYPDPVMKDYLLLSQFLSSPEIYWFVAELAEGEIIASVVFRYDPKHRLAKVYGAVVSEKAQGHGTIKKLMNVGTKHLVDNCSHGVDIIYATTRTVHDKAQKLTERLGHLKLGIFPNVHKSESYETHCLSAYFFEKGLEKRFLNYSIHHKLSELTNLVHKELNISSLPKIIPEPSSKTLEDCSPLEVLKAPAFITYRYQLHKNKGDLKFEFFPFQTPNLLLTNSDQSIELFFSFSKIDGHTDFLGGKFPDSVSYTSLFMTAGNILRNEGARYIEIIIPAHQPKIIDSIIKASFVPCAFFPGLQLIGENRYDFVVMSKSFEILDFSNIKLTGINSQYLKLYIKNWLEISVGAALIDD